MPLIDFNAYDRDTAIAHALVWAAIEPWAAELADARPYATLDSLCARAESAAKSWTEADLDAALAHHPRIGARPVGDGAEAAASRAEQAAVTTAASETVDKIRAANLAYEERFGRVFLIRAAGRSADDILANITTRMNNDDATETAEAITQLTEIALLRLRGELATTDYS